MKDLAEMAGVELSPRQICLAINFENWRYILIEKDDGKTLFCVQHPKHHYGWDWYDLDVLFQNVLAFSRDEKLLEALGLNHESYIYSLYLSVLP